MDLEALADDVLEARQGSDRFLACARALGKVALADDPHLATDATRALFERIIEPWSDSFDPQLAEAYVDLMTEIVYLPGSPVAARLAGLGYAGPAALRERFATVSGRGAMTLHEPGTAADVRKVIVLSRVTLGADVAVSSVFLNAARATFRHARIDFMAPPKNASLLADGRRIFPGTVSYRRSGLLADRLRAWLPLRSSIARSVAGMRNGTWLVVDPDSRLTQLGLLPVTEDRFYRLFCGRSFSMDDPASLARLAARTWRIGQAPPKTLLPSVSRTVLGKGWTKRLGATASARWAAVTLGFGGNERKRLGAAFEDGLLDLLRRLGYRTILDYGAGRAEQEIIARRVRRYSGTTAHVASVEEARRAGTDLVTVRTTPTQLARWIAQSDVLVGYDSLAVHLGAALGVPVIDLFVRSPNELFRRRWTPAGRRNAVAIAVDGPGDRLRALDEIRQALDRSVAPAIPSNPAGGVGP